MSVFLHKLSRPLLGLGAGGLALLAMAGVAQAQAVVHGAPSYVAVQYGAPPPLRAERMPVPRRTCAVPVHRRSALLA